MVDRSRLKPLDNRTIKPQLPLLIGCRLMTGWPPNTESMPSWPVSQDISLSVDGGANFLVTVATGLSGNTQSFVFTPSSTLGKSKTSRIRVSARDQAGNAGVDTSDGNFKLK